MHLKNPEYLQQENFPYIKVDCLSYIATFRAPAAIALLILSDRSWDKWWHRQVLQQMQEQFLQNLFKPWEKITTV